LSVVFSSVDCPYVSWENMYSNDPIYSLGTTLTPAQAALVLGGEAVLFGEFADATDVDPQVTHWCLHVVWSV
jgi:hypothetical protein